MNYGELVIFLRSKTWKALTLHCTTPEIVEAVFDENYDCSTLETLRLNWVGCREGYDSPKRHPLYRELPTFLQRFSRLKHLSIEWSVPDSTPKPKLFKLPCLTDVRLRGPIPKDYVRRLLQGLPSLQNVDISVFEVRRVIGPQDVDGLLPITRLTVEHDCRWIFRELPFLEALRLTGSWKRWSLSFIPTTSVHQPPSRLLG
ncbi:hypothetical protein CC2G_006857 [Coprinopsis cinerea AmutBmut pab1-1]|nr:hypothetical protein CC2G_006857 [Coprinopsis cinerea AmutBmut pab1-1]